MCVFCNISLVSFPGYVTDVLDDSKVYSSHANKKTIDGDDVRLAIQCRMDHSFTTPPPRDVSVIYFIIKKSAKDFFLINLRKNKIKFDLYFENCLLCRKIVYCQYLA